MSQTAKMRKIQGRRARYFYHIFGIRTHVHDWSDLFLFCHGTGKVYVLLDQILLDQILRLR